MAYKLLALFALAIFGSNVHVPICLAQAKDQPNESALRFKALIDQLASPNPEPKTHINGKPHRVRFSADYDVKSQERVDEARRALHRSIADALPYLIDALDDKRYSMTINWGDGDGYYNKTVGDICREVIATNLEVYRKEIAFLGPQHWHQYTFPYVSKEWLSKNSNRTLIELQLDAIDWAIDQRAKEDGRYAREDRAQEPNKLLELRNRLKGSKEPLPGSGLLPMQTKNR
jgi:hypothetical protein